MKTALLENDQRLGIGSDRNHSIVLRSHPDVVIAASSGMYFSIHNRVCCVIHLNFLRNFLRIFDCVFSQDSEAGSPLLLVSVPGFDPSGKVDALAEAKLLPFKAYQSLALGSAEADNIAESSVVTASKDGSWMLLRNVHLCPELLVRLEKRLHSLKPHPNFRLFLTSEMHPCLPVPLLRMSRVVVFEPPAGLVAALRRCLHQVRVGLCLCAVLLL